MTSAYVGRVGGVSEDLASVGGVFGALGGRLPFRVCDVVWAYVGGVFGALGGRLPFPDGFGFVFPGGRPRRDGCATCIGLVWSI